MTPGEAVKWFRKGAEKNIPEDQFNLALHYEKGGSVPKDSGEAVKWYRKAAEQNVAPAQYSLALCS